MMAAGLALRADGGDWPAYRHDATRCAFTTDELKPPLHPQWSHVPKNPPSPAWPKPVTERHMMPFDYAPQVVAAGGLVYFGSSTDHTVSALDLATGRLKWRFFTDAPVRFAPAVYDKKVYAASDDGHVYCLSAAEGRELWRFRAGPTDERLLGNENMISRWCLRSGLVVDDGTVYFTAGMWPSEGVYTCALGAKDGKVLWKTEQRAKFAPQGYLAAGAKLLLAPTGRSRVWIVERDGGKTRAGQGHSWAMIRLVPGGSDLVVSGPPPFKANENLPIRGGPKRPPRTQSLTIWSTGGKPKPRRINGKGCAAVSDDTCYAAGDGKITAYVLADFKKKWEIDHGRVFSLAVAGKSLVVGGDKTVAILSAATGKKLWSADVDGEARGLAITDGRLLVSTHTGRIVCFGPGYKARALAGTPPVDEGHRAAALAKQIIKDTGITAGFCLLLGAGDGKLAMALARQSGLRIYCAEPDGKTVSAARNLLSTAGLYGSRVTVHQIRPATLPYPDYFANLIVVVEGSGGGAKGFAAAELYRVLRPCGGTAYLVRPPGATGPSRTWITGPGLTRTRISAAAQRAVRGALPGTGEWTHLYGNAGKSGSSGDRRVR